jgi:hypothetical protein
MRRCAAALLVMAFAVVGCGGSDTTTRGEVSIQRAMVGQTPMTLRLFVSSCHGRPALTFTETTDQVRVRVISTTSKNELRCADAVTLTLSKPLGARSLEDLSNDETVPVVGR